MVGSEVPLAVSEASEMETEALMDLEVLLAAMEADTVVEEEETGMALVAGMEALHLWRRWWHIVQVLNGTCTHSQLHWDTCSI